MKDSLDLFGFGYSTVKYSDIEEHVEESDVIKVHASAGTACNAFVSYLLSDST